MKIQPERETEMVKSTPWCFDKTINLPFLVTVASAIIAMVIWSQRVDNKIQNLQLVSNNMSTQLNAISPRIERMDERGEGIRRDLDRVMDEQAEQKAKELR